MSHPTLKDITSRSTKRKHTL